MTPDERDDLLSSYALGLLGREESTLVEDLVARDARAAAELSELYEVTGLMALDVPLRRPDPALRERVLRAAREGRGVGSAGGGAAGSRGLIGRLSHHAGPASFVAAAAAAVAFFAMWWAVDLQSDLSSLREDTAALSAVVQADAKRLERLSQQQEEAATAEPNDIVTEALTLALNDSDRQREVMAAVTLDEQAWGGELDATDAAHGASARYLWSTSVHAGVLIVRGLPELPLGSVYQVWLDDGVSAVSGGLFTPNERGDATVLVEPSGQVRPLWISVGVSPAGGSEAIGQPIVLTALIDN